MSRSGIAKIFAPIAALIALLWALIEFSQILSRIKMVLDGVIFISNTYNSATSAWEAFNVWKTNVTYQISQPIFNAVPFLDIVPGLFWDIIKVIILLYIALWLLDQFMR